MRNWKLLFLMAVIVPALSFTSCSDDNEDPVDLKTEIVAKWKWQNQEISGIPEAYKETINNLLTAYSPYTANVVAEFKKEGSELILSRENQELQRGTYEIKNNTTVITKLDDGMFGLNAEYTAIIKGNTLTLTMSKNFVKEALKNFDTGFDEAIINLLLKTFKFEIIFEKVQ